MFKAYIKAIGLSIEFTCHVVRTFALKTEVTRKGRVIETMATMGPAVFNATCVLAFS